MMNFRQIEVFRAVIRTGSMSAAGRLCGSSQPAVSRMIRHVEDRLKVPLFIRTGSALVPTREAMRLFEESGPLFEQLAAFQAAAGRLSEGSGRVFRVGASPSVAHALVPAMLRKLLGDWPALSFQLDTVSVEQAMDYLLLGRGEAAITVFPIEHLDIVGERLGAGRMVAAVPRGHRLDGQAQVSVADLVADRLVTFPEDTPHGLAIAQLLTAAKVGPRKTSYVRFAETAVALVAEGLGVALVDEFTVSPLTAPGVVILPLVETVELSVFLHRRKSARMTASGARFASIARNSLSPPGSSA